MNLTISIPQQNTFPGGAGPMLSYMPPVDFGMMNLNGGANGCGSAHGDCKHGKDKEDKKERGIIGDILHNIFGGLFGGKKSKKSKRHHDRHGNHHGGHHGHGGGPSIAINLCNSSRGFGF